MTIVLHRNVMSATINDIYIYNCVHRPHSPSVQRATQLFTKKQEKNVTIHNNSVVWRILEIENSFISDNESCLPHSARDRKKKRLKIINCSIEDMVDVSVRLHSAIRIVVEDHLLPARSFCRWTFVIFGWKYSIISILVPLIDFSLKRIPNG